MLPRPHFKKQAPLISISRSLFSSIKVLFSAVLSSKNTSDLVTSYTPPTASMATSISARSIRHGNIPAFVAITDALPASMETFQICSKSISATTFTSRTTLSAERKPFEQSPDPVFPLPMNGNWSGGSAGMITVSLQDALTTERQRRIAPSMKSTSSPRLTSHPSVHPNILPNPIALTKPNVTKENNRPQHPNPRRVTTPLSRSSFKSRSQPPLAPNLSRLLSIASLSRLASPGPTVCPMEKNFVLVYTQGSPYYIA